ncbi:FAS1 domain-containing protein [Chytridium lagenaria]|nr:FAS1 domain-containing protein [Chytridium lagenaria]
MFTSPYSTFATSSCASPHSLITIPLATSLLQAGTKVSSPTINHQHFEAMGRAYISTGDKLQEERDFSSFVKLIEHEKGFRDEFERGERMTVFAPTNDAVKRFKERYGKRDGRDDIRMKEMLMYHIIPEHEIGKREMRDGVLFKSNLELDSLDGEPQRIRLSRCMNDIYLNMHARVDTHKKYDANNGMIWAIKDVLVPPPDILTILYSIPTKFSITTAALNRVHLTDKIKDGTTLFVPDNAAWEKLDPHTLYHLFSQHGRDDLEKIVKEGKMEMTTELEGERIGIETRRRHGGCHGWWHGHHKHESPRDYLFIVNDGETRIWFTDGVAENGVIHVVSDVLIPKNVKLPGQHHQVHDDK